MSVYRIAKWNEIYETADSRRHKRLEWVSMPVGFNSNGYQSMLDEFGQEAAAVYGAWCALVSLAATAPERGLLATSKGEGWSPARIARMTYLSTEVFEKLIPWASSQPIGWLEVVTQPVVNQSSIDCQPVVNQSSTSQQTIDDQPSIELPNLTLPNITIPNTTQHIPADAGDERDGLDDPDPCPFDFERDLWSKYPKRNGKRLEKAKAVKQWGKLSVVDREEVCRAVGLYADHCEYKGALPKDCFRWLTGKHWKEWLDDEPDRVKSIEDETKEFLANLHR